MYYEIYFDSLLLTNFVMNLYLLLLVDCFSHRAASVRRIFLGAAVGATASLIPFGMPGPSWFRMSMGVVLGCVGMIAVSFRIRGIRGFWAIFERLLFCSFLLGGGVLCLLRFLPEVGRFADGIFGVMGVGAVLFLLILRFIRRSRKSAVQCVVTLVCGENVVQTTALVDSGNSLREPVSGKPVSVIDFHVFEMLWEEEPGYYRAIPFRSVGCTGGILKGYPLQEIRIETEGILKVCRDVYVAVNGDHVAGEMCDGKTGRQSVGILLNPALLQE